MKATEVTDWQTVAKTDVVARILETAKQYEQIGQDTIAEDAYLSRPQTGDYLALMTKNELLKFDALSGSYRTTRKGEAFLRTYHQMGAFIDLIDEEIGL